MDVIDCCETIKETDGKAHAPRCAFWCNLCGRRKGVSCNCSQPFSERVKQLRIDRAALKRFHEGS